ncbi:MAG: tRNA-uridine aminocarboxypropyltransferase [Cellvibrio sp.]|uniref:tRNA-uridine aminocarboxypropyltransferase n=1 Tax=Cellvibrio sp. TaxID=1965322 RepID=UPI00272480A8|nr:tRNA-uridine aminocarboxypropyltransferase [Cellvibrio sp.]
MIETPATKRPTCSICARPVRNCICALVSATANQVEVLILQHPDETPNSKNTAGLLNLSLKNTQLRIGESFAAADLNGWLFADQKQPLLLYPEITEYKALGLAAPQPPLTVDQLKPSLLRLVVIDATWRKSRKMIYLNAALQSLPRMTLAETPESIYKIRKAHNENQLSTLEASCYALQQLEQHEVDYAPLLTAMSLFVAQQSAFTPK